MTTRRGFANSANQGFDCGDSVILLPFGRESYLSAAAARYQAERVELGETTDRIVYRLRGEADGITLVYSGMGGPAAANALEMVAGNGGRRVILFGACGGVGEEVGVGDLIVASGGVRGDGVSAYYAPAGFPAACDPLLTAALWRTVDNDGGGQAKRGMVFTTDASYRQGPELYEHFAGMVVGVDCECAAGAVVAARLGLELGALLFVTDNVTLPRESDRHYRGLADERVRHAFERGLAAAVRVLREAAGSEPA